MRLLLNRVIGVQSNRKIAVVALSDRMDDLEFVELTDEQLKVVKDYMDSKLPASLEIEVERSAA